MSSTSQRQSRFRVSALLGEIFVSAAICCVFSALWWTLLGGLGPAGALMFGFGAPSLLLVFAFAPFVLVAIYGIATHRPGIAGGPFLVAVVCYGFSTLITADDEAAIARLVPPEQQPRNEHAIIALDGGRIGNCDESCVNFMAFTGRSLAFTNARARSPRWTLYKPASGDICAEAQHARLTMSFLAQGHIGLCAVSKTISELPDALIFRSRTIDDYHRDPEFPFRYRGRVHEFVERAGGRDTMLARGLSGGLKPILPGPLIVLEKRPGRIEAGFRPDTSEFLAHVAQRPADTIHARVRPFAIDAVVRELEAFLGRTEIVGTGAVRSVEDLALHTAHGIFLNEARTHPDETAPTIARLLASNDSLRIAMGLQGLSSFPLERLAFADEQLFALIFTRLDQPTRQLLKDAWQRRTRLSGQPLPDGLRDKARARSSDAMLDAEQRQILTAISGS